MRRVFFFFAIMLALQSLPIQAEVVTRPWSRSSLSECFLRHLRVSHLADNRAFKAALSLQAARQEDDGGNSVTADDAFRLQTNAARTCASQLIAVFSGRELASSVEASRSADLMSCVRLLVPLRRQILQPFFDEDGLDLPRPMLRKPAAKLLGRQGSHRVLERLIRWPPRAVLDLAKRAVESRGDPSAVMAALSPVKYDIPDVEGSVVNGCLLTKYDYGLRFCETELNAYLATLFQAINVLAPSIGFNVSLSRFDLFHGHVFLAYDIGRLGILFHAREYPAFDEKRFPYNLGYCQTGSKVAFDDSMDLRNILWLAPLPGRSNGSGTAQWLAPGALFILDAKPDGIVFKELVPEYLDLVRTISEYDFGTVVADVHYFNLANAPPEGRIFIC